MLKKRTETREIEVRFHRHNIRFNDAELELVHQYAATAQMTIAEYIRSCAMKKTDRIIHTTKSKQERRQTYLGLVEIQREFKCQGNNLNQIAKAIHEANLKRVVVEGYIERLDAIGKANRGILDELEKICERVLKES